MRVGCIAVSAVAIALSACGTTPAPDTSVSTPAPSATAVDVVPHYEVIGDDAHGRRDGGRHLYVAIDPVDLSNEDFKADVKRVLADLARDIGGPAFTAQVYDDRDLAAYAHAVITGTAERSDDKTRYRLADSRMVAFYSGEDSESDWPYRLAWYPWLPDQSLVDSAAQRRHEGDEQWRPMPDPTTPPPMPPSPLGGEYAFIWRYLQNAETWTIRSGCDAIAATCTGQVSSSAGWSAPISRTADGPWVVELAGAEASWTCGRGDPRRPPSVRTDVHFVYDPGDPERSVASWVVPAGACENRTRCPSRRRSA
jgi:hypothetical protein